MPKLNKQTVETVKTIIITVLITGIVAFVGGVKYERANSSSIQSQAKSIVTALK